MYRWQLLVIATPSLAKAEGYASDVAWKLYIFFYSGLFWRQDVSGNKREDVDWNKPNASVAILFLMPAGQVCLNIVC